ncbi:inositol monophosphatase 1-like isoform X2 [Anthonomus grandis grandis]|uniref:inositol monophosphatase 1-like isoform X2 n=1 Tax=Anthonomus grandis grandis TaxID=2921223 RepID=UPI00216637A9|nr:inositol monophosphatase 1-like isoform X2 [Anthonomus grandis grandis]
MLLLISLIKSRTSNRSKKVETKSGAIDFVTETDQEVEKLLIEGLTEAFPDHKFIGEESVSSGAHADLTDAPTWIIDPVDGTMNFVHSFPHSCISIALFVCKVPTIGIIYNPMLGQLFTAQRGKGAYLNGERITVSGTKNLSDALIMMEFGTSRDPEKRRVILENQQKLMPQVHGLRALGSAALNMAMVACGAADAYFEYGIHIWDIAAGELIITEAGGVVIDPAGGQVDRLSRRVLGASSQELAEQLAKELTQFYPERD